MTRKFLIALGVRSLSLSALLLGTVSPGADGADLASVDLTGDYSAIVTVRNADGSPAVGKKYRLSYYTPDQREVVLNKGTDHEFKFQFEPVRLFVTIAAGEIPSDGRIRLNNLAGEPRKFRLAIGEDLSRPGAVSEGFLGISFPEGHKKTNEFALELAKVVALGEMAPNFSVHDVFTGATVTRSNFTGKFLVLKFWATDCAPCQPEMEENNQVLARRKGDWKDKVAFVAVSLDEDLNQLRNRIRSRGWTEFQHVWTKPAETGFHSEIGKSYGILSIPTCYVVHPSGVVVWRGNFDNIERITDHLLKNIRTPDDIQAWIKEVSDAPR